MARRMFSPTIVDSDAFLDMPLSSQALYFHLGMRADDDGFVSNPKMIIRTIGGSSDDLNILFAKRFIIGFENGVIVIKHWRINNLVRKDWYKETLYRDQKDLLEVKKNGAYTEKKPSSLTKNGRLVNVGKDRIGKEIIGNTSSTKGDISKVDINNNIGEEETEAFKEYKRLNNT